MLYTCPCCGYKTLEKEPPGSYDICKICFWEDDPIQFKDPDYEGGANEMSLRQAQKHFIEFGGYDEEVKKHIINFDTNFEKDFQWSPVIKEEQKELLFDDINSILKKWNPLLVSERSLEDEYYDIIPQLIICENDPEIILLVLENYVVNILGQYFDRNKKDHMEGLTKVMREIEKVKGKTA